MRLVRALGLTVLIALMAPVPAVAGATDWIRQSLNEAASTPGICGAENAAARGTLKRLGNMQLPENGKVLVVNIPSGIVTAYEDGVPIIESKAVVGGAQTQTPEMDTHVTFVRPNPTWTVPRSIIKRKNWLEKLEKNPSFFDDNGFDIMIGGQVVSSSEAADNSSAVSAFVQRPGPSNALGAVKIGIENDQAIYLHDTNDPGKFESEVRAASAGCVRVERVREIAAWIMGVSVPEVDGLIDSGDTRNHSPSAPVRVILGYWTAWPDDSGSLRYYPDIYNLDGRGASCSGTTPAETDDYESDVPTEHTDRPRFEPGPGARRPPPVWTEYQVR